MFVVVDPGSNGASVVFDWLGDPVQAYLFKREGLDAGKFAGWLREHDVDLAVIEEPLVMPQKGARSMAKQFTNYGLQLGALQMVCSAIVRVDPRTWAPFIKKTYGGEDSKTAAVNASICHFNSFVRDFKRPRCEKFHDGVTDCLAMGLYYLHSNP